MRGPEWIPFFAYRWALVMAWQPPLAYAYS